MTTSCDYNATRDPIVIALCEQSGNMVRPWANHGYECFAVDTENNDTVESIGDGHIHYVDGDVRDWTPPTNNIRIAFAFPPCTNLAISGARWFKDKGLQGLADAIELVAACHETVSNNDCPWLIENPMSTLSTYWREPDYKFNPCEYDGYTDRDEAYTKETWLWTNNEFNMPAENGVTTENADNRIHAMPPSDDRSEKRAETPTGFAQGVFLANEKEINIRADSKDTQQTLAEF